MTTAEQNAKAIQLAATLAQARQKLIDYQTAHGSHRASALAEAVALVGEVDCEFDAILSDMQQTS